MDGSWKQVEDDINGEAGGDYAGMSVSTSVDGKSIVIGAPYHNGYRGSQSGRTRVFEEVDRKWKKVGDGIDGEDLCDRSGMSVATSTDGERISIGAPFNDGNGYTDSGHVRVYVSTALAFDKN